ncbi:DUF300-domain-containing protein [Hortaea werneckii]|nr:DUF300-domain-containing protein [Hortaea werneckii]KAI7596044.1 DUF300-domain-containing protein [Hortaea werneckii]
MYNFTYCNTTLEESFSEEPLWHGFTFHHFGLFLALVFAALALLTASFLIFMHATHYSRPWEQRHIIRILLMIPVYAVVSFLSYLFYKQAVYFEVLRDCYEAFAIASFFTLLCHYVAPDLHRQKEYFRGLKPIQNWFWGVFGLQYCTGGKEKGPFRVPRSGLTWFNVIWIGVFQYCFIRVLFTIVSVVTEEFDVYCEASLSPLFAHVWTLVFECASVTIAMFCLIQFYIQLREDLAEHRPFMKVLCIKLVIFFSFWQTILISFLSSSNGPLRPSKKISYQDIKVGIPSVMLCIEMAIFAVLHLFAFPWKEYSLKRQNDLKTNSPFELDPPAKYYGGPLGIKALVDTFNPWDIVKASARGFRWLFVGYKHREKDISYQTHKLDGGISYPTYTGLNGAAATTESRLSDDEERQRRERADTVGTVGTDIPDDDRAGLLHHSALPARMPSASPYRTHGNDEDAKGDDSIDLGGAGDGLHPNSSSSDSGRLSTSMTPFSEVSGHGLGVADFAAEEDTGYHPATIREQDGVMGAPPLQWDHWAGAERPGDGDGASSPPTYHRTGDPYR